MFAFPLRTAALTVAAAIGLSACATPYGYGGVSVGSGYGYGSGYGSGYYDPYYSYGSGYGYGYNDSRYSRSSYYGWNDGFYYPGTGYYVYDRNRRPHRWTDAQRRYWSDRVRTFYLADRGDRPELRENWRDFRRDRRSDDRAFRTERRDDRRAVRSGTVTREQFRTDRREDRRAYRT